MQDELKSHALEIKRPRSALHAGDFDQESPTRNRRREPQDREFGAQAASPLSGQGLLGTSPNPPWYQPSPRQDLQRSTSELRTRDYNSSHAMTPIRSRAPSIGSLLSSSFVYRSPTTPLIYQSSNADFETSPDKGNRRHTLPPFALQNLQSAEPSAHRRPSLAPWNTLQQERQNARRHSYRRSLNSTRSFQHSASPPSSILTRSRRTSFSSEASPLQHASMVGSYEESILQGRMSAAPSRPLNFTAQIGVMGKGSCKPKCPPHVSVPFPAVYYSWSSGRGRRPDNDEPSPYVGQIDLHNSVPPCELGLTPASGRENVTMRRENKIGEDKMQVDDGFANRPSTPVRLNKRRRTSPLASPPDGSYRIPEQGQLQIVIKNPNKTAVKLFLVPYDLSGMEAGNKTFIRQRLLSAGPIIEHSLSSTVASRRSSLIETGRKPTLRYLIHLNICCPSKGRFYLYQHIRVVFANRVPDNKEQLRTETQLPEPRFSLWKPTSMSRQSSSSTAKGAAEDALRRRSLGFTYGEDIRAPWASPAVTAEAEFSHFTDMAPPVPAIPFTLPISSQRKINNAGTAADAMDVDSSRPTTSSDVPSTKRLGTAMPSILVMTEDSHMEAASPSRGSYSKLRREDEGFGGFYGRPSSPVSGEGLLAQKLKSLGVQRDAYCSATP